MLKIIPYPASISPEVGIFRLTENTSILVPPDNDEVCLIGQMLSELLRPATGFPLLVMETDKVNGSGGILLELVSADPALGEEGYELKIRSERITLSASHPAGLFHGIQTIRQLLPAAIEMKSPQPGPWMIEAVTIRDRDEMTQDRVPIVNLVSALREKLGGC